MGFVIEMVLHCSCGKYDSIDVEMNSLNESCIQDEINNQSKKFRCSQGHPDEVHIACLSCGDEFNLGT